MNNNSVRVLIADDDKVVRHICRDALTAEGFQIFEVENGQMALDTIIEKDYDLLLTDLEMPVLDGMALLSKLRDIPVAPPIIMITAHSTVPIAVQAVKWGAYDFITKPFLPDALVASVRRALSNARLKKDMESFRTAHTLMPLVESIINALDSRKVMEAALNKTCELLQADGGSIMLYDHTQRFLTVTSVRGANPPGLVGKRLGLGERVAGHVAATGCPVTLQGPLNKTPQFSALPVYETAESSMVAPLMVQKELVGVLSIKRVSGGRPFGPADEQLFLLIARYSALALSNALVHEDMKSTKELLEQQMEQRATAFERTLNELQELKNRQEKKT